MLFSILIGIWIKPGPLISHLVQYINRFKENIRIYYEVEVGIGESIPRITVWHHKACRVMTNRDPEGRIFLSHPDTQIMDSFSCLPLSAALLCLKRLPEILEYADMGHDMTSL